jgi:glycosyltransferase involved in cell wall biosynthesis
MKISIIIPCYNQAQYLGEAIESCLAQTITPHEIIVVNDCSPDNTEDVAMEYPVQYIARLVNGGLSAARNTGIRASSGDYVVTLDADDKLPPDYLEKLSSVDADIVGCGYRTFGDYEKEWKSRGDITLDDLLEGNRTQCSALFKRKIFDLVQFDEEMKHGLEDWLFFLEALTHGFTMKCTDSTYLLYRKHGVSMVSENPKYVSENTQHIINKLAKLELFLESKKTQQ